MLHNRTYYPTATKNQVSNNKQTHNQQQKPSVRNSSTFHHMHHHATKIMHDVFETYKVCAFTNVPARDISIEWCCMSKHIILQQPWGKHHRTKSTATEPTASKPWENTMGHLIMILFSQWIYKTTMLKMHHAVINWSYFCTTYKGFNVANIPRTNVRVAVW